MKRTLLILALMLAAIPCAAEYLLGTNITVKCRVIVRFTYAANYGEDGSGGVQIAFPPNAQEDTWRFYVSGAWVMDTVDYADVKDALADSREISENLQKCLNAEFGDWIDMGENNREFVAVEKSDRIIAFAHCVANNRAAIDVALSEKWKKIHGAITGKMTAPTQPSEDKEVTQAVSDLTGRCDAYAESLQAVQDRVKSLKSDIESARSENSGKISQLSVQLAELKAQLNTDNRDAALLQIGEVQNKVAALTMQQGVLSLAVSKIPELEERVKFVMSCSGGLPFAVPPQVQTYSNQISRLSVFLGSTNSQGVVGLPLVAIESEADSSTTESDDGGTYAKYLMRHLWENGFVPWFPAEAEASDDTFPANLPPYMSALWGSRYFYDEEGSGGEKSTHAVGIDMPVEWKLATRPWVLDPSSGMWLNAHVQFGSQMDSGNGSIAAIEGDNYVVCNLSSRSISISSSAGSASGTCSFYVGTVTDGKQTGGSYYTPMIFMWE